MKSRLTHDPITVDPLACLNFTVYTVRSPPVTLSKTDMREGSLTTPSFAIRGTAMERASNRSA